MYGRLLLLMLLLAAPVLSIRITEVMSNPAGSDTNREWIEVYNNDNESYNLSAWKLVTDNVSHALNANESSVLIPGNYVVIVQDILSFLIDYPYVNTTIDSSWTSLSNSDNETVTIKNASIIFDSVILQPVAEGNSSCLINGTFSACVPTPGAANEFSPPVENATNTTGIACGVALSIDAPELYESVYAIIVNNTNCTDAVIEYWIEDLFGNLVKEKINTTQTGCFRSVSREWKPPVIEGAGAYRIFATSCNATTSKIIVVKGSPPSNASSITITSADSGKKFGETEYVDLRIYRGDTSKYAVDVYARNGDAKVSGVSKFHAGTKFRSYEISVPVQLKPNCDGKYGDGTYTIVAEGLDAVATWDISVSGVSPETCRKEVVTVSGGGGGSSGGGVSTVKPSVDILAYPETVRVGDMFNLTVRLNLSRNYTVYSYVFRGNTPVSEGFDGSRWGASWTANRQSVRGPASVTLQNRIEDETPPGLYTLRVRAKSDREEEISRDIEIKERVVIESEPVRVINNTVNLSSETPLTGMAVRKTGPPDFRLDILNIFYVLRARLFKL